MGKIIAGVGVSSALLGRHGSLKQLTRKIKLHLSEQHAEGAKAMARSVALQDRSLYEKLKEELERELSPEEYERVFGDFCDPPSR
ncbi:MAG: hypothetical protein WBN89_04770 [Prochlorococcaceae cyanobacterium]